MSGRSKVFQKRTVGPKIPYLEVRTGIGSWWNRVEGKSHDGELKLAIPVDRDLRDCDGSRYSRCRFRVLPKPILGTADSKYWHCLGVRSFLLEIPQASMNRAR